MAQYLDYGFQGRPAIITGAGTGMGRASAVELARGGAKVALFGRRADKIQEALEECLRYTDKAMALSVDVSDETAVKDGVGKVLEAFGKVDILINNAGIESRLKPGQTFFEDLFDTLSPEEYLKFFKIHALGHYLMNLAVIPSMQKNRFGRIVNITSVTGVNGAYSTPGYTASKAAAICQTKAFAKKYGKDNITVNSIAPGMVDTPMKIDATPEEYAAVTNKTPLGRVAQPVDIARVAMFFAQENLFVSGQNLIVDGGATV
ncbi:3-oxoacyl-[acyl-carrier protein] reductase [Sporobacter termitidis DSM 10068]|uniref:3-oxoacyl-[acyl-carrier protein] reductase n=1 Tax=Sporobacter termitidis DSM 10068 TaxID=1123282 RepID=A0A1M5ZIX5_9FIRM|nr:SDR family oxidoreductase [Sporobacter termitidis]SHI24069.1 3-oxoacyl-[acyl-carrier protein] reductase [Sporobacter termitidis DSM 10068]